MNIMGEIAVVFGICLLSVGISAVLPFAFPASVIGMLLLLLLLALRIVREQHIGRVSGFLTGNMSFFFVAPCVSLMQHFDELISCLLPFLIISLLTTPLVYAATAWTIQWIMARCGKGGGS